jgi:gamma-glutamylcyclotransferase (GGCT)/AIG2-like uncharacterized protein YtfP
VRDGQAIYGELYRVDEQFLAVLDAFEDAPREYTRAAIELQSDATAQAYFYRGETGHLRLCGAVWVEEK